MQLERAAHPATYNETSITTMAVISDLHGGLRCTAGGMREVVLPRFGESNETADGDQERCNRWYEGVVFYSTLATLELDHTSLTRRIADPVR
jgi:hypothetical protein